MLGLNNLVANNLGVPLNEARHAITIASSDIFQEIGLEFIGDSTPGIGWLTEFAEAAIDVRICYMIWTQYHGVKPWKEFIKFTWENKANNFWRDLAKYGVVSGAKIALKVVPIPVIGHAGGFVLNTVQT